MRRRAARRWATGLLLWLSSVQALGVDRPSVEPLTVDAIAQSAPLTKMIEVLWQEAVLFADIGNDQKQIDWALNVDARIIGPYLRYWRFSGLLDRLLVDTKVKPNEIQRQALERSLANTMSRYVFEVLIDRAIEGRRLDALEILQGDESPNIRLTISGPFGLPIRVVYVTEVMDDQWGVVDMVVAGIEYSQWKGRVYKQHADNGDWNSLLAQLEAKNHEFFVRFCDELDSKLVEPKEIPNRQITARPLPSYLTSACLP